MKTTFAKSAFREASLRQAEAIRRIADRLSDVQARYEPAFEVDFENLEELERKLKARNWKGKSGVYLFFTEPTAISSLCEALHRYRDRQSSKGPLRRKSVPCPNKGAIPKSGCFYVGKSEKGNLETRLRGHFIDSSRRTGALKLSRWAAKMNPRPKVWVEVLLFETADREYIRDIEKAFWTYFEPAIGEK